MSVWSNLLHTERSNIQSGATPRSGNTTAEEARSEFQRDYDRSLFSTPVRRLQDKAQVFPLEPHDSVRTRLTHSLEVANIAQALTRRALHDLPQEFAPENHQELESLVAIAATCGLIHDLGNPPFGHAGETSMAEWFTQTINRENVSLGDNKTPFRQVLTTGDGRDLTQDFEQFDGNPQTLRLVTKLTMLADYDGLSLTLGTLAAALKYIAPSDGIIKNGNDHAREKAGYFFSEEKLVKYIRYKTGLGDKRHPITFLVEAADDIVYSVVDLEDGIKKGSLTWGSLKAEFEKKGVSTGEGTVFKEVEDKVDDRLRYSKMVLNARESDEAHGQLFRTLAIRQHISAVAEVFQSLIGDIISGLFAGELLEKGKTVGLWKASKKIARAVVFPDTDILRLELMGRNVLHDLMTCFWQGIKCAPYYNPESQRTLDYKAYMLLSENYRKVFEHEVEKDALAGGVLPVTYRQLQLLADYVCGMTDTFAVTLHRELFNG